jgi:hypothetical protein
MAELIKVRSLTRRGIRIGNSLVGNTQTVIVDLDDPIVRRDLQHHSAIGALVVFGETLAAVTGAQVTPGTTTTVSSAAGSLLRRDGTVTFAAANNQAVTAADVTNPRIDLLSRNAVTGAVTITAGTAAATPVAPVAPVGQVAIATILVPANAASSAAYTITDVAPRLS